ncbi:MAG: 23S rRNA (adenine(2503)-C(2))-methyltransferase RlmN, partial [Pseudomonadota bacterium]|nr:23S rRNA (adenine(2503)-C(2))-methyltransferase RlmN [Pseudomonadota bacterium]
MADTALMSIPGLIDPVPTPRDITARADGRVDLIGLPKARIAELFAAAGLDAKAAKLRAKQVFHWLYHRGVTDFAAMTDIAKDMRPWLAERFVIGRPEVVLSQHSSDGTRKWLLKTADDHEYEMVFIPDESRGTLCVSSQVGCTLNCRFCHTGTMRLVRNLTPGEIVGQVMLARDALGEWPNSSVNPRAGGDLRQHSATLPEAPAFAGEQDDDDDDDGGGYTADGRLLTNIVMMGMGEPLYNFDNVRDALKLVMDGDGLGLSRRRITLSTSGVVPMM